MTNKKRNWLLITLILPLTLSISNCSKLKQVPLNEINDNYRTMYQIFPISYADSNKDGKGDLQGIIDKLDYIQDMNYTGLWLTPIHPSPSYHKYDVNDYKAIDPTFGTIETYDKLVSACHEKNMTIILDLVFNHTSTQHEWFKQACTARKANDKTNKYYDYYNFTKVSSGSKPSNGWALVPGSNTIAYECRFYSGMPDLNLSEVLNNPKGNLATDLKDILKFWLIDRNIDGFRLDAVTSYFTGETESNLNFLTWLNTEAKALKKDCYIVGEASWDYESIENKDYQASGVDSFFMFANANLTGYVGSTIVQQNASFIPIGIRKNWTLANGGIPAPFLCNHDTGRAVGAIIGRTIIENAKFGNALLQLMNGTTFTYYGDEIGMAVSPNGINNDPNKRQPMNWGDDYTCQNPPGTKTYEWKESYPYPSVKEQLKDKKSLLNYIKKANLLRRQFPEIARGTVEISYQSLDDKLVVMKRTYNDSSIYIAINASNNAAKTFKLSDLDNKEVKLVAELSVEGTSKEKKGVVTVPKQGIAILR